MNLAHDYVQELGMTVEEARDRWDGCCIDFAGALVDWDGSGGKIAYLDTPFRSEWRYHAAAFINGLVHDLWKDEAMPLSEWEEFTDVSGGRADLIGEETAI